MRGTQSWARSSSRIAPRIRWHGEALEARAAPRVEALDRVDETEDAALDEVGVIDVGGQPHQHAVRHDAHERRVAHDEPVAGPAGRRREILRPLLVEWLVGGPLPRREAHRVDTTGPATP